MGRAREGGTTIGAGGPAPRAPSGPIPLRLKIGAIGFVVIAVFGFALFAGFIPGLHPRYSNPATIEVRGLPYYWTNYEFPWPIYPANTTEPTPVLFHDVNFSIWVTHWYIGENWYVEGNGTEPNGTVYSFQLTSATLGSNATSMFVSPDDEFGAVWHGQLYVTLLVLATSPPAT